MQSVPFRVPPPCFSNFCVPAFLLIINLNRSFSKVLLIIIFKKVYGNTISTKTLDVLFFGNMKLREPPRGFPNLNFNLKI